MHCVQHEAGHRYQGIRHLSQGGEKEDISTVTSDADRYQRGDRGIMSGRKEKSAMGALEVKRLGQEEKQWKVSHPKDGCCLASVGWPCAVYTATR